MTNNFLHPKLPMLRETTLAGTRTYFYYCMIRPQIMETMRTHEEEPPASPPGKASKEDDVRGP